MAEYERHEPEKARLAWSLFSWMVRATNSFPVPLSPVIKTVPVAGGGDPASGGALDIYGFDSTPTMVNCTFSNNISEAYGGAVTVSDDAHLQLVNCGLWANAALFGDEIRISYPTPFEGGTVTVSYSDVAGGEVGVSIGTGGTLIWGAGNIDEDPLFVDRPNGDYRLTPASPCIDTGHPAFVPPPCADLEHAILVRPGGPEDCRDDLPEVILSATRRESIESTAEHTCNEVLRRGLPTGPRHANEGHAAPLQPVSIP